MQYGDDMYVFVSIHLYVVQVMITRKLRFTGV